MVVRAGLLSGPRQIDDVAHRPSPSTRSARFRLVIMVRVLAAAGVDVAVPAALAAIDRRRESRRGSVAIPVPLGGVLDLGAPGDDQPLATPLATPADPTRTCKRERLFFAAD